MQLTIEQVKDLLQKAGVQVVVVEKDEDSDFNLDTALAAIDTAREPIIKGKIGDELVQTAVDEAQGKMIGAMKSEAARISGLQTNEFNGLKPSEILKKVSENIKSTLDTDKQGWLTEREQMANDHEAAINKIKGEESAKTKEWESKYNERDLREFIRGKHKTLNLPTTANREDLADEFFELNKNKFKMSIEGDKIVLTDSTGKRPFKEGSTSQFLEIDDLINSRYEKAGLIVKDARGERADQHMKDKAKDNYDPKSDENKPKTLLDRYEERTAR